MEAEPQERMVRGKDLRAWERHLEGWQLGVVALGIALLGAVLAVPQGIGSNEGLPLPIPDRGEERASSLLDQQRTREARHQPLPFAIRRVGELIRNYGLVSSEGDEERTRLALATLQSEAKDCLARLGEEPLLILRSVQTELFLMSLSQWELSQRVGVDLRELGGDFASRAEANGWCRRGQLLLRPEERRILFRVRWTRLLNLLSSPRFAPTLGEWRLYYRTLLLHPERQGQDERGVAARRLDYVLALSRHDLAYPEQLARGILEQQVGRPRRAVEALDAFLGTHPDGPYRLRALNHRATALKELSERSLPEEP